MSREVKRRDYEPRESLKQAGITKITAEIEDGLAKTIIIVEHGLGDKQPIMIPVTKEWYGDVRENFKAAAEKYFIPDTILQLDREIGAIYIQVIEEETKEQERRAAELKQKSKQAKSRLLSEGEQEEEQELETRRTPLGDYKNPISVKQALFADQGSILTVYGQISTIYKIHSMIQGGMYQCVRCFQPQFVMFERPYNPGDDIPRTMDEMCRNCEKQLLSDQEKRGARGLILRSLKDIRAIKVELMDSDTYSDIDTLQIVFFGDKAQDIKPGERITVRGKLHILQTSRRSGHFYPILYAHDVRYEDRDNYELTSKDIDRVERFVKLTTQQKGGEDNTIDWLVRMYAPHMIWNEFAKEAMLYLEVSAGPDVVTRRRHGSKRRKRLIGGLVGNPGLGKSMLLRVPTTHDSRNRYESAQSSSGRTLTAIVSKEGESVALRIGALSHAKEAVISVNEFGRLSLEEQGNFLDAAEEGEFTINKQGIHAKIRADTVIIWSSNPVQAANWSDNSGDAKVSLDDLPILKEFIDRSDILVVLKPITDQDRIREYSRLKGEIERHPDRMPNYNEYVKTHLMVARRYYNPTLTEEASAMLEEAHVRIQQQMQKHGLANAGSFRIMDRLIRLTESIAKLKLKREADERDAKRAISFYNTMYTQMHGVIAIPDNPRDVAYRQILYLLQNESKDQPVAFRELVEEACRRNSDVNHYFKGGSRNIRNNWQMQSVRKLLENHSKVKRVPPMTPITFKWVGDFSGTPSPQAGSDGSDASDEEREGGLQIHGPEQPSTHARPEPLQEEQTEQPTIYNNTEGEHSPDCTDMVKSTSLPSLPSLSGSIQNKEIEEDYNVLKAMQLATLDYKESKALGKESGSLFTAYDVWYHLATMFPGKEWDLDKVRKVIRQQTKKGRVITRQGDDPDRYYLLWQDEYDDEDRIGGLQQ